MGTRSDSLTRPLLVFGALALLALGLVAGTGVVVVREVATDQALAEARQLTLVSARLVEQRLTEGLLTGDAIASAAVSRIVHDAVLPGPIVRVKIWTRGGRIVYSDESRLIGSEYPLDDEDLEVLERGGVISEVSDLSAAENRLERPFGELLEVYTRLRTPEPQQTPLLFETYQLASSIADRRRELAGTFVPVLVATLVALALLMVPIAWILARRVRAAQRERERLMQRVIESSDRERRRIAADLHDGPVQELAGLSMALSASAGQSEGDAASALRDSASAVRGSVRTLRSAIVGIYPANLQQVGLAPSLSDLVAGLPAQGIDASVEVDPASSFGPDIDALLYRACQEAIRNVVEHADARAVRVSVRPAGDDAVLEVVDDGRGVDPELEARARGEGHMGLAILADLVADQEGRLSVGPAKPSGTVVRVQVPIP